MEPLVRNIFAIGVAFLSLQMAVSEVVAREAWVGSPFSGTWPTSCPGAPVGSTSCGHPLKHWIQYSGDWSADFAKGSGSTVKVFVAPQNYLDTVTTVVESVRNACKATNDPDGTIGGKVVRIGVSVNGSKVGTLVYSHVKPGTGVSDGATITRWGGTVGTVHNSLKTNDLCWTGPHLHFEINNVSDTNTSCFNNGFTSGQAFSSSNFIGFVGVRDGNPRATKPRQPCP